MWSEDAARPGEGMGGAAFAPYAGDAAVCAQLEGRVLDFIRDSALIPAQGGPFAPAASGPCAVLWGGGKGEAGRRVVVALSGGADSMALLRILLVLAPQLKITIAACHVNHCLRGDAADRDEAFVRAACKRLGVSLLVQNAAQLGQAPPPNAGEEWARRLRYSLFDGLNAEGDTLVATAHTLSDQAETLLFRLARGTGLHGAACIPARRGIYIRPLLCLARADTERYCAACGQAYVTDETNLSDVYARNRLRQAAVPALRSVNEAAERNLGRFCEKMARADAYFTAQADTLLAEAAAAARQNCETGPWSLSVLQDADPLILESALHRLVGPLRDAEERLVAPLAEAVRRGSGAVQLTGEVRLAVRGGQLFRENARNVSGEKRAARDEKKAEKAAYEMPLFPGHYTLAGGYELEITLVTENVPEKTQHVHKKDLKNIADYAKITTLSTLRARLPGDRYRPAGRGVDKPLKKYLNEEKFPAPCRDSLPLIACGSRVVWLWGRGFADGLAPDETTKALLCIQQVREPEENHEHA